MTFDPNSAGINPDELQSKYGIDPANFRDMLQSYIGQSVGQGSQGGGEGGGASQPTPIEPGLQKLIDQGFMKQGGNNFFGNTIASGGEGGTGQSAYGLNPDMMPQSNGLAYTEFQDAPKAKPGGEDASLINPNAVWNDPIYGKGDLTENTNIRQGTGGWLDTYGPMIVMASMGLPGLLQGLSAGGLAGGFSALQGGTGLAGSMAQLGEGLVQGLGEGKGLNPISLAGTALGAFGGQLGLPDMGSLSKFMPQILQMAAGRGINPMQLIMALTRAGKGS